MTYCTHLRAARALVDQAAAHCLTGRAPRLYVELVELSADLTFLIDAYEQTFDQP